jgi:hypothetical protein
MSLEKMGVPKPVTASQPSVAGNPLLQNSAGLLPSVMSSPMSFTLYNQGLRNPRVGSPLDKR